MESDQAQAKLACFKALRHQLCISLRLCARWLVQCILKPGVMLADPHDLAIQLLFNDQRTLQCNTHFILDLVHYHHELIWVMLSHSMSSPSRLTLPALV